MKGIIVIFLTAFTIVHLLSLHQLSAQEIDTVSTEKGESVFGRQTFYITELNIGFYNSVVIGPRFFDSVDIFFGLGSPSLLGLSAGLRYVMPYRLFSILKPQITIQYVFPIFHYEEFWEYTIYKVGFSADWKNFYACVDYNLVETNENGSALKRYQKGNYYSPNYSFGIGYKIGL